MSHVSVVGWAKPVLLLAQATLLQSGWAQSLSIPSSAYRTGQPEVIEPVVVPIKSELPPVAFDKQAFAATYAKAGKPSIAVLWNRQFTDMIQQDRVTQITVDVTNSVSSQGSAQRIAGGVARRLDGQANSNLTIAAQEVKSEQTLRNAPVERLDLQIRSAFVQTIVSAGGQLVDRNLVMRNLAAKLKSSGKGANIDAQQLETEALSQAARLLMEVLNTPDPASPTGWATYVSIKRLADGVVLAEGYTGEQKPPTLPVATVRFEADPRGGFREVRDLPKPPPALASQDLGRMAAEQALNRLSDSLR